MHVMWCIKVSPAVVCLVMATCYLIELSNAQTIQCWKQKPDHHAMKKIMFSQMQGKFKKRGAPKYPVILVPGDGGCQFQAKLDKSETVHFFCAKSTNNKWFDLWLNLDQMVPYIIDCWVDNMRLEYDLLTGKTSTPDGVEVKVPGFGNTTTMEYLDSSRISVSKYFSSIVNLLISEGYERGINIRGAPFDFRRSPGELDEFFTKFKSLIEDTYEKNKQRKVVLVAHSMGNPMTLQLLNSQPQDWLDKYVKSFVGLAGVWGGSVKPFRVYASGDNLDIFVLPALKLRKAQRTYPSLSYLMPQLGYWNETDVFISTENKNYSLRNIKEFFHDIKYPVGYDIWRASGSHIGKYGPPRVEMHCLHGNSVKTADTYIYGKGLFPDTTPQAVYGDGDGTVNIRSLRGCLNWKQDQPVSHKEFKGADHMSILHSTGVLAYVKKVLDL